MGKVFGELRGHDLKPKVPLAPAVFEKIPEERFQTGHAPLLRTRAELLTRGLHFTNAGEQIQLGLPGDNFEIVQCHFAQTLFENRELTRVRAQRVRR